MARPGPAREGLAWLGFITIATPTGKECNYMDDFAERNVTERNTAEVSSK
jgi:hypothetical protein